MSQKCWHKPSETKLVQKKREEKFEEAFEESKEREKQSRKSEFFLVSKKIQKLLLSFCRLVGLVFSRRCVRVLYTR